MSSTVSTAFTEEDPGATEVLQKTVNLSGKVESHVVK